MHKIETLKNFMTADVVTVTPDMPLASAVEKIVSNNFNGVPVVDASGKLVGMLTELELMVKGSSIHLPTLLKLLGNFDVYGKDQKFIKNDLKKIATLKVKDIMNKKPITLKSSQSVNGAVNSFCKYREVNPIPIVDEKKKIVGIISRYDIVRFFSNAPLDSLHEIKSRRSVDKSVNVFLGNFEKNFLFVSKFRTYYWIFFSLLSAVLGFSIAFLIMIRIVNPD